MLTCSALTWRARPRITTWRLMRIVKHWRSTRISASSINCWPMITRSWAIRRMSDGIGVTSRCSRASSGRRKNVPREVLAFDAAPLQSAAMAATDRTIQVSLKDQSDQSYAVTVRRGLLADVGASLRRINTSGKAIVISDTNLPPHYLSQLRESLQAEGYSPHTIAMPPGEEQKAIEHVVRLYDQILPMKVDRQTLIVAFGGGVIGDLSGFVAATVLRGVPFVQIPTTLLAMVDACVGGKTGVNHRAGKNMIGAFHQPIAVLIDPDVLRTLPPREIRNGLAECIKHDVIRDAEGFARLEADIGRALSFDLDYLNDLIAHNVAIKAKIVMADPLER